MSVPWASAGPRSVTSRRPGPGGGPASRRACARRSRAAGWPRARRCPRRACWRRISECLGARSLPRTTSSSLRATCSPGRERVPRWPTSDQSVRPPTIGRPAKPTRLDLRPGTPDVTSFPVTEWLRCTRRALGRGPRERLRLRRRARPIRAAKRPRRLPRPYPRGPRPARAGRDHLRRHPSRCRFCAPLSPRAGGTAIAMENPGFNFHRGVVRQAGLPSSRCRSTSEAPGADHLGDVAAAVVTPAHQYPTGVTMHRRAGKRSRPGRARRGGLIVEDDYDGEFRYDRQPIGALPGHCGRPRRLHRYGVEDARPRASAGLDGAAGTPASSPSSQRSSSPI